MEPVVRRPPNRTGGGHWVELPVRPMSYAGATNVPVAGVSRACSVDEQTTTPPPQNCYQRLYKLLCPKRDPRTPPHVIKILLLGMSEVGKSTFVKQMQLIHGAFDEDWNYLGTAYTKERRLGHRDEIHTNIYQIISTLIEQNDEKYHFAYDSAATRGLADRLLALRDGHTTWTGVTLHLYEHRRMIRALWSDSAIQRVYEHRNEFDIHDWAKYYLDDLERIADPTYVPTVDDVLRARKATEGSIGYNFCVRHFKFLLKDIGGEVKERQKLPAYIEQWRVWVENESDLRLLAVVYIAALDDYDQIPEVEQNKINAARAAGLPLPPANRRRIMHTKLDESICMFEVLQRFDFLTRCNFMLLLNKEDVFREKLNKLRNFHEYYEDFHVENYGTEAAVEEAKKLIIAKFTQNLAESDKPVFVKTSKATNTDNMEYILAAIHNILISEAIGDRRD